MSSRNPPEPAARPRPWSLAARLTAWYAGTAFLLVGIFLLLMVLSVIVIWVRN